MLKENKRSKQKVAIWSALGVLVAIAAIVVTLITRPRPEQDFTLSVIPMQGTIQQGAVTQTTIHVKGTGGYKHPVSLSTTGQIPDVLIAFSPPFGSAAPAYTSTMTVNVGAKVRPGDCIITIKGTGADGKEHTCKYTLSISIPSKSVNVKTETTEPIPQVAITTPKSEEEVPISTTVTGTISGKLPEGRYMWVVINPHTSPGQWWPQGGRIEPWSGHWNAPVILGREAEDKGVEFDIAVILVNEEGNNQYNTYLETGVETGNYPGISLPRSAATVQRITVKRK
jgi:hypothetical protein